MKKDILKAAGRLATISGVIVGEDLNLGPTQPCNSLEVSELLKELKEATREYNRLIMKSMGD